jgi:hypothetical protein
MIKIVHIEEQRTVTSSEHKFGSWKGFGLRKRVQELRLN